MSPHILQQNCAHAYTYATQVWREPGLFANKHFALNAVYFIQS